MFYRQFFAYVSTISSSFLCGYMAVVVKLALFVALSAMILQVRRKSFVGSDCIGLSIEGEEIIERNETYINSSLWQVRGGKFRIRHTNRGIINILLLLCGDIETCPGPDRCIPELNALLKKRGIKIFHQNVRGLLSNIAFVAELLRSFPAIDILTLSETQLAMSRNEHYLNYLGIHL